MAANEEYVTFIIDQLRDIGSVEARRMFGGATVYLDGIFFGFISDDVLTLKTDKTTWADFEKAGVSGFSQSGPKSPIRFYEIPADILESREDFGSWAKKAIEVAKRHKQKR